MFKKLVSILFEEEEITIEEDLNETPPAYDIPKLKPMAEKKKPEVLRAPEFIENYQEKVIPETLERKVTMIDVDTKVEKRAEVVEVRPAVKPVAHYQPKDIISPIFGGPESPSKPIESKTYTDVKTRQPLTEIISPMFGKVEVQEQSNSIDASLLEIELSDMLSPIDEGEEVQASLFDYLEGFDSDEE